MFEGDKIKNIIVNNPIIISLSIYLIICLIIYLKKPKSIFRTDDDEEFEEENIFKKNINLIFILLPFIIYVIVSAISSSIIRDNYCDILKQKEINIKELIKKCKK